MCFSARVLVGVHACLATVHMEEMGAALPNNNI